MPRRWRSQPDTPVRGARGGEARVTPAFWLGIVADPCTCLRVCRCVRMSICTCTGVYGIESRINYYDYVPGRGKRRSRLIVKSRRKKKEYILWICINASNDPSRWRVRQSGRELSFPRGTYNSNPPPLSPLFSASPSLFSVYLSILHSTNRLVSTRAGQLVRVMRVSCVTVYIYLYSRSTSEIG